MDSRSFLGSGYRFPVTIGPDGGFGLSAGERSVTESIWLVLSTARGERVMNPEFGCAVHELVLAPVTDATFAIVAHHVRESLTRWEPRIEVLDVRVTQEGDLSEVLLVAIDYRLEDNNAMHNLVYPFYIGEGELR
ncbi:baseplate protein [Nocardia jinanensis]|uniref:Baseplate protein n=1 Tax=Nocardia jinanensis TaxID=382504 RepID=A0A917RLZ7_9NOCA|nr:baseplate protein [Nocardia jinanensis]